MKPKVPSWSQPSNLTVLESFLVLTGTQAGKSVNSSLKDGVPKKYCIDVSGFREERAHSYLLKDSPF